MPVLKSPGNIFDHSTSVLKAVEDWKEVVEPLLRCPGRKTPALCGLKQSKLPCGHSVCGKCALAEVANSHSCRQGKLVLLLPSVSSSIYSFLLPSWLALTHWLCQGQQERRLCPKCEELSGHAADYNDLRSSDDPRSSVRPDTDSMSDAPVGRWVRVCDPSDQTDAPFTEDSEHYSELVAAEERWAMFPDENTVVTRYWHLLQNGRHFTAKVSDS